MASSLYRDIEILLTFLSTCSWSFHTRATGPYVQLAAFRPEVWVEAFSLSGHSSKPLPLVEASGCNNKLRVD